MTDLDESSFTNLPALENVAIGILQVGFSDLELQNLRDKALNAGACVVSVGDLRKADVLIVGIKSPSRIARNISSNPGIRAVTSLWIDDSIKHGFTQPFAPYEVIIPQDLRPKKTKPLPTPPMAKRKRESSDDDVMIIEVKPKKVDNRPQWLKNKDKPVYDRNQPPRRLKESLSGTEDEMDEDIPIDARYKNTRFECERRTPLNHFNAKLVSRLEVLERARELSGEKMNALAYRHAISVLKSYPRDLKSWKEAQKLKGIGPKVCHVIKEFLQRGKIVEADDLERDERFKSLDTFSKIYGVGPQTARDWYNRGYKTVLDVLKHEDNLTEPQRVGLMYHEHLSEKMTRSDVQELVAFVEKQVKTIVPDLLVTPVGGYRRGKTLSGDLDIVIAPKQEGLEKGLIKKIVKRLADTGCIQEMLSYAEVGATGVAEETGGPDGYSQELLDKAYTILKQPSNGKLRQVDLIVCAPSIYPCCVIGWTGSKQFERSLRDYVHKTHGWIFQSWGLYNRATGKRIPIRDEKHFFETIGIPYIPPEERNA